MLGFRAFAPEAHDFSLLAAWLKQPHWQTWWDAHLVGGQDMAAIRAEFTADPDTTIRLIAQLDGLDFGYFQLWWDVAPPGEMGMDQSIGPAEFLGQGLGSAAMALLADWAFDRFDWLQRLSVDPHPDNKRAIGAYSRVGFRPDESRSHDDVLVMLLVRDRRAR